MRLRNTAPAVKFRAEFPEWMEPKGAAFIEIDARPAGQVNSAFMAAQEEIALAHAIRGEEIGDAATPAQIKTIREFGRDLIAVIFDTCVITWRTNLIDDETGQTLTCDRETFLALADVRIGAVSQVFVDFQQAIADAGKKVLQDTEATVKN